MTLLLMSLAVLVLADLFEQVTDDFISVGDAIGVPAWVRIFFAILVAFGLGALLRLDIANLVLHSLAAAGAAGLLRLLGNMLSAVRVGLLHRLRR